MYYQYKTSSPHSTSNRKWEKARGLESPSLASRYHALSSFISSRFSLSFQPHSLCSYLQEKKKKKTPFNNNNNKTSPYCAHKANAAISHGLHVGSGEFEGPFHR